MSLADMRSLQSKKSENVKKHITPCTVEPRFNKPLFNEVLDIMNKILHPSQSCSKLCMESNLNNFITNLEIRNSSI